MAIRIARDEQSMAVIDEIRRHANPKRDLLVVLKDIPKGVSY